MLGLTSYNRAKAIISYNLKWLGSCGKCFGAF